MTKGVGVREQKIQALADFLRAALHTLFTSLQRYEWNGFSRKGFNEHKGIPFSGRPSGGRAESVLNWADLSNPFDLAFLSTC